jgi:hypothetical protein
VPTLEVANGVQCGTGVTSEVIARASEGSHIRWYNTSMVAITGFTYIGEGKWTTPINSTNSTYYADAYNGVCSSTARPVTVTIHEPHMLTLLYGVGSLDQELCSGTAITTISYYRGGGTAAPASTSWVTWTGFPENTTPEGISVTVGGSMGANQLNISSGILTRSEDVTYTWTILTKGTEGNSCGSIERTGTITVVANPAPINGPRNYVGIAPNALPLTLTTTSSGGTWSSTNEGRAIVDQSGVVTGISAGSVIIRYTFNTEPNCFVEYPITVVNCAAVTLTSAAEQFICPGKSATITYNLTHATSVDISWKKDGFDIPSPVINHNTATRTITVTLTEWGNYEYTITSTGHHSLACSPATATGTITIANVQQVISGNRYVGAGLNTPLTITPPAIGTWSSENPSIASVNTSGVVTGVSAGITLIRYTLQAEPRCYITHEIEVATCATLTLE